MAYHPVTQFTAGPLPKPIQSARRT